MKPIALFDGNVNETRWFPAKNEGMSSKFWFWGFFLWTVLDKSMFWTMEEEMDKSRKNRFDRKFLLKVYSVEEIMLRGSY